MARIVREIEVSACSPKLVYWIRKKGDLLVYTYIHVFVNPNIFYPLFIANCCWFMCSVNKSAEGAHRLFRTGMVGPQLDLHSMFALQGLHSIYSHCQHSEPEDTGSMGYPDFEQRLQHDYKRCRLQWKTKHTFGLINFCRLLYRILHRVGDPVTGIQDFQTELTGPNLREEFRLTCIIRCYFSLMITYDQILCTS